MIENFVQFFFYYNGLDQILKMGKFSQETIIRTYRISQNYPHSPWGRMISEKKIVFFFRETSNY